MIIREMEAKDVMGIVGLIRNDLGYDDITSDVYDRVIKIYNADKYEVFIAEENGAVIGFVGIMRGLAFELDGEYVRVIALAVSHAYRSKGIGSRLEARVEKYAEEIGANSIVISSGLNRNRAHVFYGNKGYEKKGYSFIKRLQPEKKFSYEDVVYTPIPSRLGKNESYDTSWLDELEDDNQSDNQSDNQIDNQSVMQNDDEQSIKNQ